VSAIDPTADPVFRMLFGTPENRDLLIHFLNAVIGGEDLEGISELWIIPNDAYGTRPNSKLVITDLRAIDQRDRKYQLEMQKQNHRGLPQRFLFNWSRLFLSGLGRGQNYGTIAPVTTIWLMGENLMPDTEAVHVRLGLVDGEHNPFLEKTCRIHIIQLKKLRSDTKIRTDKDRWFAFFRFGPQIDLDHPPPWMNTPIMRRLIDVMKAFTEEEVRDYHQFLEDESDRILITMQDAIDDLRRTNERQSAQIEELRRQIREHGLPTDGS